MSKLIKDIDSTAAMIEKALIALKGYIVSFRIEAEFNTQFSYGDDEYNRMLFEEHGISKKHSKLKVDHYNFDTEIAYMEYTNAGYILGEIKGNEQEILENEVRENPKLHNRFIHFISESTYIDKMRIDRKMMVHNHDTMDMNTYRRHISAAINYLSYLKDVIFPYWKEIPGYFVENDWKEERIELLITEADELLKMCRTESENKDYVTYKFKGVEYAVSKYDSDDMNLLALELASNWYDGIKWIMVDDDNKLGTFIETAYGFGSDELLTYREYRKELSAVNRRDIEENRICNMFYMELIYTLNPCANAIYWRGKRYSESYFAAIVLQRLVRHSSTYNIKSKIITFLDRVQNTDKWYKNTGVDIDIPDMCERKILSHYFKNKGDEEGLIIAEEFENVIIKWNKTEKARIESIDDKKENNDNNIDWEERYAKTISTVYKLISYMRGKASYILPVPKGMEGYSFEREFEEVQERNDRNEKLDYEKFQSTDEFRAFFKKYVNSGVSIDEVLLFVRKIESDANFKWWIENYDLIVG